MSGNLTLFFALILSVSAVEAKHSAPCARKFLKTTEQSLSTADFIVYLELLLEERVVKIKDLDQFKRELEKNKVINPIVNQELNKRLAFHFRELQKMVDEGRLDAVLVNQWLKIYESKEKVVEEQKESSAQITESTPVYISPSGAMFYFFNHPALGEVYRILKPKGKPDIALDWEERVWAVHPLKEKNGELITILERDLEDASDSRAKKQCTALGLDSDLPTKDEYKRLMSHFQNEFEGDNIHLTPDAKKIFDRLFPKTDGKYFWTQSLLRNSDGVWLYDGIGGSLLFNQKNDLGRFIRCVGKWQGINKK